MKLVSIIIPYFKKRQYLYKTVRSAVNQTYSNIEILIIYDDEDRTDLKTFRKKFQNFKKVKFIVNKKNIGAGLARNIGIKYAKGKFIAFLDSDDYWDKDKLKIQIKYMEKKKISLSHTSYKIINKDDELINYQNEAKDLSYKDLVRSCDIGLSTVVIEKKIINKRFNFPSLKTKEDYVLWLKLAKNKFIFYGINKYLVNWRKLDNSLSSSNLQKILDGFRVYYNFMDYNFFKSIIYLIRLSINSLIKRIN